MYCIYVRRSALEIDVELRQTTVLRRTIEVIETAHGETSGLPVSAASETHVYRGRKEDAYIGVQNADATTP